MYNTKRRRPSPSPSPPVTTLETVLRAQEATLHKQDEFGRDRTDSAAAGLELMKWAGGDFDGEEVMVDRYDILHLLTSIPFRSPSPSPPRSPRSPSPGFSDLPSDSEEMFFFSKEDREQISREKKKRKLEEGRQARLQRLQEKEDEEVGVAEVVETEPSETQLALMKKLHQTLLSSPNPSLLEMKILANHSSDSRFDFLRKDGKWRSFWEDIKAGKNVKSAEEEKAKEGNGMLVAYGSDSEEEVLEEKVEEEVLEAEAVPAEEESEEIRKSKESKAEKAREWARKRKLAREAELNATDSVPSTQ